MRATLEVVMDVDVRPVAADDLAHLQRALPPEHPEAHVRRLADQRAGRVTYLIAWSGARAVGHVLVRWRGTSSAEVVWLLGGDERHPYVEALLVHPSFRSRTIGSQLLAAAERLAHDRGHRRIGLAVAVENVRARALYDRLGYRDAGIGDVSSSWSHVDETGREIAESETCRYLVKQLEVGQRVPWR
jgi:ribosomal protein S18 acetylase RimI-like enzyme